MEYSSNLIPKVYIETTVVSYYVSRPNANLSIDSRQKVTTQLWDEHSDNFEFVISDLVITEASMKETSETYTDPILEECYRVKEELSNKFHNIQELYDFLKAESKKHYTQGWNYNDYTVDKRNKNDNFIQDTITK